jgi:hypothetical protein
VVHEGVGGRCVVACLQRNPNDRGIGEEVRSNFFSSLPPLPNSPTSHTGRASLHVERQLCALVLFHPLCLLERAELGPHLHLGPAQAIWYRKQVKTRGGWFGVAPFRFPLYCFFC